MDMIRKHAGDRLNGRILEDGCGVGSYLYRFAETAEHAVGIEIEFDRGKVAKSICPGRNVDVVNSCGEYLPFKDKDRKSVV